MYASVYIYMICHDFLSYLRMNKIVTPQCQANVSFAFHRSRFETRRDDDVG